MIFWLIELYFHHPLIGTAVLICLVLLWVLYARQQMNAPLDLASHRTPGVVSGSAKADRLEQLRRHDPQFDENAFCRRVALAFGRIQQAWCAQQLQNVQLFLSDGVAERFALQFAEQREQGYHDQMEHIAIHDVAVADLLTAGVFDEISVRISAAAMDYRAALVDQHRISGSMAVEPFVEVWSFLRRRGALTDTSHDGLMEGNCPNCGAAVAINQVSQCEHCKALLRSGQYDWVLTEITQASEWSPDSQHQIPGLERLRAVDPDFDHLALEDLASVVFWRKAAADRTGKIDPLRKLATDDFCRRYAPTLKAAEDGSRAFVAECAVGGVNTLGLLTADPGEAMHRALVQVRWSGTKFVVTRDHGRQSGDEVLRSTLLVLGRLAGTKTDAQRSITSAHCPNCGGPQSSSASNACEFCGAVLNDGSAGWVLLDVLILADHAAQDLLHRARAADATAV